MLGIRFCALISVSRRLQSTVPISVVRPKAPMDDNYERNNLKQNRPISKLNVYSRLSKRNLSVLVTSTALWAYYMAPVGHSYLQAVGLTTGTFLTACSANSFNQLFEMPYDAQMERTRNRVLVDGRLLSPFTAWNFAITTGVIGAGLLALTTSPITTFLGLGNIFLYSCIYTKLKRISDWNTAVGAIVGAIPPMMGWMANSATVNFDCQFLYGGLALSTLLYLWQFPHFDSLSWQLRSEYCMLKRRLMAVLVKTVSNRAGYSMSSITNPIWCRIRAALHSIALLPICAVALPLTSVTTWYFAADSMVLNLVLIHFSIAFARNPNKHSARSLFVASLFYLPSIMMLSLINSHFHQ